MLNNIIIMGRMVADPELRTTPAGVTVTTFRIACDRDFKNKETGERGVDFVNIIAWRGNAEFIARNFSKGSMIVVNGRLQVRGYTDNEGNNRYATEIVAANVYFGDTKKIEKNEDENGFTQLADDGEDLPF